MPGCIDSHFDMGTILTDYRKTIFFEMLYHLTWCHWRIHVSPFLTMILLYYVKIFFGSLCKLHYAVNYENMTVVFLCLSLKFVLKIRYEKTRVEFIPLIVIAFYCNNKVVRKEKER